MTGLILTILLAVVWIALIAAGFWHGGWRQVVTLTGMLLAYAVASEWAAPNGHDLAAQFHVGIARATTLIGLLYLLGGTLIVGVLGGFALPRPVPLTTRERGTGAAMGILNGGLLLALVLRIVRSYAFPTGGGQVLQDSALARFLIERIGYLLILALALGAVAALIGLAMAHRSPAPSPALAEEPRPAPALVPVAPVIAPREAPPALSVAATAPEPVYVHAPLIDWPANSPAAGSDAPGRALVRAAETPATTVPGEPSNGSPGASPLSLIPAQPTVPGRMEPPMRYPVERLLTAPGARVTAPPATPSPMRPAASAATGAAPQSPPAALPPPRPFVRPTTAPPGALQPAFVPPTLAHAPAPPPNAPTPLPTAAPRVAPDTDVQPPVVREIDVAPQDEPPLLPDMDTTRPEPPPAVVREPEVATRDAPPVANVPVAGDPAHAEAVASVPPDMPKQSPTVTVHQRSEQPTDVSEAKSEKAQIPPVPPSLLSVPTMRAAAPAHAEPSPDERLPQSEGEAKPRTGFARVAVARQAGARPDQPQAPPQTPAQPEPLTPPRPTGPRVHACPVCGYPVRDHARYCPNCGSRQRS